jgi:hypothetical protein
VVRENKAENLHTKLKAIGSCWEQIASFQIHYDNETTYFNQSDTVVTTDQ